MAIDAGGIYSKLVLDTAEWGANLIKAQTDMERFSKDLNSTGEKMEKAGKNLTTKVTAPLVALGTIALKTGMDFQAGMSEVQAISGATGEDLERLEAKAKEMGAATKFSATESAEALKYMAMAGWDTEQMLNGIEGVMSLAAASGENLALVSDIVTDALTAFGMEAKDAGKFADLLASASSNSNTNVAMMGETFKYVAPLFGSLGYTAEDAALAIGLMANAGIKGSQAGTTLRAAIINLVSPTGAAEKAMKELGLTVTDAEGEMLPFRDIIIDLRMKFRDLSEEQQAQMASTIFGQQAMSGMLAIINASEEDFKKLTDATRNYSGAAKEMADIMQDNLKGEITILKSQLEGVAIQLAEILIPIISNVVGKISEWVDKFANLDKGTQETIVKMAALAAAIGPILLIGGKMTRGLGTIIGLIGKIGPAATAAIGATTTLAGGIGTAGLAAKAGALLLNPWTLGLAAATAGGIALVKHLKEDAIPAVELFTEEISEGTKEAVGSFLELEQEANKSLNQLSWSGAEVTEEMKENLVGTFEGMKTSIVSKLEEQKKDALESLEDLFKNSKSMSEKEKKDMIKIAGDKYDAQIKKVEEGNKKIKEILEKAKKDNRAITDEERKEIDRIKEEMKDTAIRVLSEGEKEQLAILERLKIESAKLTAQMAAEVVKNSKEQKDKTIAEAEREYNERLKYAATLRADGTKESEELANKVIEEAKRQKDEAVKAAEDMHQKVVTEAKAQAKEHVDEVDWESGELMSKWGKLKKWFTDNPIIRKIFTKEEDRLTPEQSNSLREGVSRRYGQGTNYHPGGWAWVGEQGRELVELPKGSKVYSNPTSEKMVATGSTITQNITIHSPEPLSPSEIARKNLQASRQLALEWGL